MITLSLCLQITALHRVHPQVAAGSQRKSSPVVFSARSGALGCVVPVADEEHAALRRAAEALSHSVEHVAGLNPLTFRSLDATDPLDVVYGAAPDDFGILDGELLWRFADLPRQHQAALAERANVTARRLLDTLHAVAQRVMASY
jgi:CPSF A subunit region